METGVVDAAESARVLADYAALRKEATAVAIWPPRKKRKRKQVRSSTTAAEASHGADWKIGFVADVREKGGSAGYPW